MLTSNSWQLGKFLDKAIDIVPVTKLTDGVSIRNGKGEAMKTNFLQSNLFIRRKTVLMPTSLHVDDGDGRHLVTRLWR